MPLSLGRRESESRDRWRGSRLFAAMSVAQVPADLSDGGYRHASLQIRAIGDCR